MVQYIVPNSFDTIYCAQPLYYVDTLHGAQHYIRHNILCFNTAFVLCLPKIFDTIYCAEHHICVQYYGNKTFDTIYCVHTIGKLDAQTKENTLPQIYCAAYLPPLIFVTIQFDRNWLSLHPTDISRYIVKNYRDFRLTR